jgi:lysophospholipase L1-like esterase
MTPIKQSRQSQCRAASFALLLIWLTVTMQAQQFALQDGDRVVFYGDEVTAVQFYDNPLEPRIYTAFVETYALTRFPSSHFYFVNSGWNGDRVSGGAGGSLDVRLRRDVLAYKPTVLTVMLGMNDAWMTTFDPRRFEAFTTGYENPIDTETASEGRLFEAFISGYKHLIEMMTNAVPGVRITVLKPTAFDEVTQRASVHSYNDVLVRYGNWLDAISEPNRLTMADPQTPLLAVLREAGATDPMAARNIVPDGVHPSAAGHLVIAEALLKAWHASPLVSAVEIDCRSGRLLRVENAHVKNLKIGRVLSWKEAENSLPLPLDMGDPAVAIVIRSSDFIQALDQETLRVNGLAATNYELRIDNKLIGTFDSEQLRAGVNLAVLDTPMKQQAARVFELVKERNNVHFGLWKRLEFPLEHFSSPHKATAQTTMEALEEDLEQEQRAAAQPKLHRYELRAVEALPMAVGTHSPK